MLSSVKLGAVVAPSEPPAAAEVAQVLPPSPVSSLLAPASSPRLSTPPRYPLVSDLCGVGVPNPRYTTTKFRDYELYCRSTSRWRRIAVILLTPIPSILTSLIPPLIPLQDPTRGVLYNTGYILHFFVTLGIVMYGSVFQVHAPLRLTFKEMPVMRGLLVAVVGSAQLTALVTLVGYVWRYPVPFVWMTAYAPYLMLLIWAHFLVLGRTMRHSVNLKEHLVGFIPSYIAQGSQVVVYPVFSALFEVCNETEQIVLTLLFPALKFMFRRIVSMVTRRFPNDAEAEAVSGVEICSVMYQTMIMQSAPSPITTAILMGIDVVQGLFSVYVLMKTRSSLPQRGLIPRARQILCVERPNIIDEDLVTCGTVRHLPRLPTVAFLAFLSSRRRSTTVVQPSTEASAKPAPRRPTLSTARFDKEVVTHALEAIQAAESIVLIEYFEVAIPIANIVYIAWASSFHSAIYNPKIRPYYEAPDQLRLAIQSLVLYTALQATSLVFLEAILWHRYRVSAMKLLAFVLEQHMWSVQGKLITWLTLNFQFPGMHYGTDFSFKFEFRPPPCSHPPCS